MDASIARGFASLSRTQTEEDGSLHGKRLCGTGKALAEVKSQHGHRQPQLIEVLDEAGGHY